MEVDRSLRAARAVVFAAACVGVSAGGHVWMSGATIPAFALLAAVVTATVAGCGLAGRERGFASIAGLMLAGEFGLHLLFTWAQHATAAPSSAMWAMTGMNGMPGMGMATAPTGGVGRPGFATATSPMPDWMSAHGSVGMVAVHAAAGLVCAWWLWRGETAVFRLLRTLAYRAAPLLVLLLSPLPPVMPDRGAAVPDGREARSPATTRLLVHAVVRRGPPAPVFCM